MRNGNDVILERVLGRWEEEEHWWSRRVFGIDERMERIERMYTDC